MSDPTRRQTIGDLLRRSAARHPDKNPSGKVLKRELRARYEKSAPVEP